LCISSIEYSPMSTNTFLGSNINLVKAHNLQAILLSFLHNERISRVELARHTSLSTTTITNLTAELLADGIIQEQLAGVSSINSQVGRPRTMLQLITEARYAVGVHIGIGLVRVAITDLRAGFIHHVMTTFDLNTPAERVIEQIAESIQTTITESGVEKQKILGVGVGASGLVDFEAGVNVLSVRLGWHDVPIADLLQTRLNLPVCVDNNVRCMALGEAFFGAGRGVSVLAFVYGRIGVGAGFVVNGQVFRGSGAGAGEIGHTIMVPKNGELCSCGNTGCLETLVSERVLIRQAFELAKSQPESKLADYLRRGASANPLEMVFSAACDGDEGANRLVKELATQLGIALSNLVNVLNPELILLGGLFSQGCDLILPVAEKTMRETAFGGLGQKVRLEITSFGWRAGVTGAAALALMSFFYQSGKGCHV
jgi:glucokinase-like ROK family protein